MALRAVLFDFFGVISVPAQHAFLERKISDHDLLMHVFELRRQHDLGYIDIDEYLREVAQLTGVPPDGLRQHLRSNWVLNQPLVDYIYTKMKGNYRIGLLSNAAGDLRSFVPDQLIKDLFDELIISGDVGMVKPNPEIFELACERMGVLPAETVMIDDIEENCDGARAAGLQAITYDTSPQCIKELKVLLHS